MRLLTALLVVALSGCEQASPVTEPLPTIPSACRDVAFDGSRFWVCRADGPVEIRSGFRSFTALAQSLGERADDVAFAMNAGMFDEAGKPIGLLVEDGREAKAINRRKGGGNFHLLPNGVFAIRRDGSAVVTTTEAYGGTRRVAFATQSGPMLLIDGNLHPAFDEDGDSKHIRNAVGVGPDGKPLFVISRDAVSFGKLARFYRDALKVRDALYLDGSVSSLWDPANDRLDAFTELGPLVVAFRSTAPEARPTSAR